MEENRHEGWFYNRPSQLTSFWVWLFYTWDFRIGWKGPYVMLRERGWRFLGLEHRRVARVGLDPRGYYVPEE